MGSGKVDTVCRKTPAEVFKILQLPDKNPKVLVIDVREDDFAGGHIPHCRNVRAGTFDKKAEALTKELKDLETVIFHCMYSATRGPLCAKLYASYVPKASKQQIFILKDGYRGWNEAGLAIEGDDRAARLRSVK